MCDENAYVPDSIEECVDRLGGLMADLDEAIEESGDKSLDVRDLYRVIKWVLDGAVKAGYIENNITEEYFVDGYMTDSGKDEVKTMVYHNTFGNYDFADIAYWRMYDIVHYEE